MFTIILFLSLLTEQLNCSFIEIEISNDNFNKKVEIINSAKKINLPYVRKYIFTKEKRGFYKTISNDILLPDTPEYHFLYTFYHEIGHVIDYRFEITDSEEWKEIKKSLPFISEYSKTNDEELFAELIAYYLTDKILLKDKVKTYLNKYLFVNN